MRADTETRRENTPARHGLETKRKNTPAQRNIETKREREKTVVSEMIALYCRENHHENHRNHHGRALFQDCAALAEYARQRSDKCPCMETKTFCSNCTVHCYKPEMREKIRAVMRYSGPRMLLHHPVMAVRHVIEMKKEKKRLEGQKCG